MSSAILKTERHHTRLGVVQDQDAADKTAAPSSEMVARTGCPCSPKTSQKIDRRTIEAEVGQSQFLYAVLYFGIGAAGLADSGKVAFHIGGKNPHADALKLSAITCSVTVLPVAHLQEAIGALLHHATSLAHLLWCRAFMNFSGHGFKGFE